MTLGELVNLVDCYPLIVEKECWTGDENKEEEGDKKNTDANYQSCVASWV